MSNKATCETCRFWQREDEDRGVCKRYAPRASREVVTQHGDILWHWADWLRTLQSEWCGEHAPRKDKP